jgi:hypothetical protein
MKSREDDVKSTLVGPRNFTLNREERVRALVAGPPAFALRRRRIEDLEASIMLGIEAHEAKTGVPFDAGDPPPALARAMTSLQRLVEIHNTYYPIEASLPIDVATGELVDRGRRWTPLPLPTFEGLLDRCRSGQP